MEFLGAFMSFLDMFLAFVFLFSWLFDCHSAFHFVCLALFILKNLSKIRSITILVDKKVKKEKNDDDLVHALQSNDYVLIDMDKLVQESKSLGGFKKNEYTYGPWSRFDTGTMELASPSPRFSNIVSKNETGSAPQFEGNNTYRGETLDGLYHGYGVERWSEAGTYKGQFFHGLWHGFGEYVAENGYRYSGTWRYGLKDGTGQEYSRDDGTLYTGQFKNGAKHGLGWTKYSHDDWYAGEYEKGEINGLGAYHFSNGDVYEGMWVHGDLEGYGSYKDVTGKIKAGIWEKNVMRISIPDNQWPIIRNIELARLSALDAFLVEKVDKEVRAVILIAEAASSCS